MKYLIIILALVCFGCKQNEPEPKIEIYLLKERKPFTNCIPFTETEFYDSEDLIDAPMLLHAGYDTILDEIIYAGDFVVSKHDLLPEPFITNIELRYMDLKENEFMIDSLAAKRIYNMHPKNSYGNQFAVTIDGEPVFAGYFWGAMSRFRCDWYQIIAYKMDGEIQNDGKDKNFEILLGKRDGQLLDENLPYPPELMEAFRASGRLIE